jgi:hypothetical protein
VVTIRATFAAPNPPILRRSFRPCLFSLFGETVRQFVGGTEVVLVGGLAMECTMGHHGIMLLDVEGNQPCDCSDVVK